MADAVSDVPAAGPRIVVVVAPKGGVGKTTLTNSMLVSGGKAGLRVLGVDMDGQHSLAQWSARRQAAMQRHPKAGILDVPVRFMPLGDWRDLRSIVGVDLILVDTPPGHGEMTQPIKSVWRLRRPGRHPDFGRRDGPCPGDPVPADDAT